MDLSGFAATTLKQAQASALVAVTAQVAELNSQLIGTYQTAFSNWLLNWTAGRISDKTTAPVPPAGYVVGYFDDPTSGPSSNLGPYGTMVIQWPYPALGTSPVCAQPAIPAIPPPFVQQATTGNATVQNVPVGDLMPVGSVIVAPDGSKWEKMASVTPFGMAYYYAKVG